MPEGLELLGQGPLRQDRAAGRTRYVIGTWFLSLPLELGVHQGSRAGRHSVVCAAEVVAPAGAGWRGRGASGTQWSLDSFLAACLGSSSGRGETCAGVSLSRNPGWAAASTRV